MKKLIPLASLLALFLLTGCGGDAGDGNPDTGTKPPPVSETCTAESCPSGCCNKTTNQCNTTRTTDACGPNGTTCSKCDAGQFCHPNRQECFTPILRTQVRALRASIAAKVPSDGSDWDADGSAPDVVVELECPSQTAPTRTEEVESFQPEWSKGSCDILTSDLLTSPFYFRLLDIDVFYDDEITPRLMYQATRENLDQGLVQLAVPDAVTSLTFQFTTYYTE